MDNGKLKTRWVIRLLCGGLLAGALVIAFDQRNEVATLRRENQRLLEASLEAERLAQENQEIQQLRAANPDADKSRASKKDELLKLRGEVGQLRRQKQELDKLRADNQRLRAEPKPTAGAINRLADLPGYIANANWANAGFGTPEAAVQTYFWAVRESDLTQLLACLSPGMRQAIEKTLESKDGPDRQKFNEMIRQFASLKGYRVAGKEEAAADKVVVGVQAAAEGETLKLSLRRFGNEWKIAEGED